MKNRLKTLSVGWVLVMLVACGGGASEPTPPQDTGNWDSMTWDQDNWA